MAFVYKSEREISPEIITASGDIGPGQYLPQNFLNNKNKANLSNIAFNSNTYREIKITKDDNPGPGSYTYNDKYEKLQSLVDEKQAKPASLLKSLELVSPDNLDPFAIILNKENSKEIAFLSKEKRFKENPNNYPGVGQYSKDDPMFLVRNSIKNKKKKRKNYFNEAFKFNKDQLQEKSILISESDANNKNLILKLKPPVSPYRVSTIPSKNFCYGFDISPQGQLYVKEDPDRDVKFLGDKADSVGPGAYELENKNIWKKNIVSWEKQSRTNRNTLFNSQEITRNKNLNLIEQSLNRYDKSNFTNAVNFNTNNFYQTPLNNKNILNNKSLNNDSRQNNLISTKNEIIIFNQKNKYEKDKVFKHIRDKRQKLLEMRVSKNNIEDDLFDKHILNQEPGPGYYLSDIMTSSFKPIKVPEKFQSFGSNSLRFEGGSNEQCLELGPGAYFKDDEKYSKEKLKKFLKEKQNFSAVQQQVREEIRKERNETLDDRVGINGIINQHKIQNNETTPGPGNYDIGAENFLTKKSPSKLTQFGSLQKRFNENIINPTPGPGSYLGLPKGDGVNLVKFPIRPKKLPKIEDVPELQPDLSIFPKDTNEDIKPSDEPPGVGSYNSDILFSLGYKVAKNVNKFNNSTAPFNIGEKRFNYKNKMIAAESIGPGQYYKDNTEKKLVKNLLSNSPPFNTSAERKFAIDDKNDYRENGPGSYNLSSYFDWNKKSFNVQFL